MEPRRQHRSIPACAGMTNRRTRRPLPPRRPGARRDPWKRCAAEVARHSRRPQPWVPAFAGMTTERACLGFRASIAVGLAPLQERHPRAGGDPDAQSHDGAAPSASLDSRLRGNGERVDATPPSPSSRRTPGPMDTVCDRGRDPLAPTATMGPGLRRDDEGEGNVPVVSIAAPKIIRSPRIITLAKRRRSINPPAALTRANPFP